MADTLVQHSKESPLNLVLPVDKRNNYWTNWNIIVCKAIIIRSTTAFLLFKVSQVYYIHVRVIHLLLTEKWKETMSERRKKVEERKEIHCSYKSQALYTQIAWFKINASLHVLNYRSYTMLLTYVYSIIGYYVQKCLLMYCVVNCSFTWLFIRVTFYWIRR